MSEATQTEAQLPEVEDLGAASVDSQTREYVWGDHEAFGEEWESYEACECEECGEVFVCYAGRGGEQHKDMAAEDGNESDCAGYVDFAEGPMMNYFYPVELFGTDEEEAARRLLHLPLAVVTFKDSDEVALALTGGGMNLSWEICEGYMRLGQLPPLAFCDLPHMAGRGASAYSPQSRERDLRIVEACRASCEHAAQAATWTRKQLGDLLPVTPEVEEPKDSPVCVRCGVEAGAVGLDGEGRCRDCAGVRFDGDGN